jgi:hypothetical protein
MSYKIGAWLYTLEPQRFAGAKRRDLRMINDCRRPLSNSVALGERSRIRDEHLFNRPLSFPRSNKCEVVESSTVTRERAIRSN